MTTPHVSHELLTLILRGELPPRTLVHLVRDHLSEICPHCARALEDAHLHPWRGHLGEADDAHRAYEAAFDRAADRARCQAHRLHDEKDAAMRELRELRRLPAAEAERRLADEPERFRSPHLAALLLAEARRRGDEAPGEAGGLARLALAVLERVPAVQRDFWVESLGVRARAAAADALRAAGDPAAAADAFRALRARLASHPCDDPEAHAEVSSLEAALRREERRFAEAGGLLARAVLCYRQAGRADGVARALIRKGIVHRLEEDPETALECFTEAVGTVSPDDHLDLRLRAVCHRALCLCDLDRAAEAAAVVDAHRRLFERSRGAEWRHRLARLEGRIAHGLGRGQEAEGRLAAARDACLAAGDRHAAALSRLDLMALYLEQGRWDELAVEAVALDAVLEPSRLGRPETAAVLLFQQAVAARRATMPVVRRLATSLEHMGDDLPPLAAA